MPNLHAYEYLIYIDELRGEGDKVEEHGTVVVGPKVILARNPTEAVAVATRAVPEKHMARFDQVNIRVRQFG